MTRKQPIITVPDAPVAVNAALPIAARLDECLACADAIHGPEDVSELHRLRIAVKRLRYTVEVFSGAIAEAEGFLRTLKRLQDHLGEIHDADVLAPLLADAIEGSEAGRPGLRALHERTIADRAKFYEEFRAAWDEAQASGFPERLRAAAYAAALGGQPASPEVRELLVLMELSSSVEGVSPKESRRARKALSRLSEAFSEGGADERQAQLERANRRLRRFIAEITG